MKYPKDHLVIHKEPSLNAGFLTHYLVNTYYDYAQTYYFKTLKDARAFVKNEKNPDVIVMNQWMGISL